ncbi:MAG: hypothetical protein P9L88_06895 [Candidatus Tantalella remota]|nr:hypothetical protein [Candidatus Tantalella remota]
MKRTLTLTIIFILTMSIFSHAQDKDTPILKRAKDFQAGIKFDVVQEIKLPKKGYHEGLYMDGKNIWVANGEGKNTWIIDSNTGELLSEIEPVGKFTEIITGSDDDTYWVTDWETKKLYRVAVEDHKMLEVYSKQIETGRPTGAVWTGTKLYVITWERGAGTRYYLNEFNNSGELMGRVQIKRVHEPSQLAWDGKYLWITSWFNKYVYKVDLATNEILGSFKAPFSQVTGIVWDGKYLWLTGTRVGLYKLELIEE